MAMVQMGVFMGHFSYLVLDGMESFGQDEYGMENLLDGTNTRQFDDHLHTAIQSTVATNSLLVSFNNLKLNPVVVASVAKTDAPLYNVKLVTIFKAATTTGALESVVPKSICFTVT